MTSPGSYLSYGAIGLGLALALLSYYLLSREQKLKTPRSAMLRAIFVFMGFSLVLCGCGFLNEYSQRTIKFKESMAASNASIMSARAAIIPLLDLKAGQIARLRSLNPIDVSYQLAVKEIVSELDAINKDLVAASKNLVTPIESESSANLQADTH